MLKGKGEKGRSLLHGGERKGVLLNNGGTGEKGRGSSEKGRKRVWSLAVERKGDPLLINQDKSSRRD